MEPLIPIKGQGLTLQFLPLTSKVLILRTVKIYPEEVNMLIAYPQEYLTGKVGRRATFSYLLSIVVHIVERYSGHFHLIVLIEEDRIDIWKAHILSP